MSTQFPSCFNGVLDCPVYYNEQQWAVTMVCNRDDHAMLIVEGVLDKIQLLKRVHLLGPYSYSKGKEGPSDPSRGFKVVRYHRLTPLYGFHRIGVARVDNQEGRRVYYTHKSETWIRSAEKVQQLLRQAQAEQANPSEHPRAFCILGRKSKIAPPLTAFEVTDPLVAALGNYQGSLFQQLWSISDALSKKEDSALSNAFYYPFGGLENVGYDLLIPFMIVVYENDKRGASHYSLTSTFPFLSIERPRNYKEQISKERFDQLVAAVKDIATQSALDAYTRNLSDEEQQFFLEVIERLNKIYAQLTQSDRMNRIKKQVKSVFGVVREQHAELIASERIDALSAAWDADPIRACKELMLHIYASAVLRELPSDNCFTWAREKLTLIDVELPDRPTEALVSKTKLYLIKV
ncbi:MAG: hypothetical protein S4CHLAM2_10390 [Chlamydiales bacterium]|nr:hypothetical protein [Chlamydiales bacterium]